MLQFTITNGKQRRKFQHESGPLFLGRAPHVEGKHFTINDEFVSRDQLSIEEAPEGNIHLENRGRKTISLPGGKTITQGKSQKLSLPLRMTVGQTVIEVTSSVAAQHEATLIPLPGFDGVSGISILPAREIGKKYPYPLAFGFRLLSSITSPAELYKEQLRLGGNVLAFIGSVALSLLDDDQLQKLRSKSQGAVLKYWRDGISPCEWLTLAILATEQLATSQITTEQLAAEQLASINGDTLAQRIAGLRLDNEDEGVGKHLRELIQAKSDYEHDRGPAVESEYREASDRTGELLLEIFRSLSFFNDHQIVLVQNVNPKRRGQGADVVYLKCIGDHPGFDTEQVVHSQILRAGDLYIERDEGQMSPLFPLLHATTCSQCKAREFYFVDRVDHDLATGGVVAGLKSFERGHTEQDQEIGQELSELFAQGQSSERP